MDTDPKKFVASLVRVVADEGNTQDVRAMACVVLKNFIINRSRDPKFENYWVNLDLEFKTHIKTAVLATLASPHGLVRRQIA